MGSALKPLQRSTKEFADSRWPFMTSRFGFAVKLVVWLILIGSIASVGAAVRFDVFLGYDGILPEASWFPVSFEVQNDGPSFTGVVEISPGQFDQGQSRLTTVD